MCNCSSFVGDTPYLNRPLHAFNGTVNNFDVPQITYKQAAGAAVDAGYGLSSGIAAGETNPNEAESVKKRDWLGTILPYADKLLGIERAPETGSSVSTGINQENEEKSYKVLWWSLGIVVFLVAIILIVRATRKK